MKIIIKYLIPAFKVLLLPALILTGTAEAAEENKSPDGEKKKAEVTISEGSGQEAVEVKDNSETERHEQQVETSTAIEEKTKTVLSNTDRRNLFFRSNKIENKTVRVLGFQDRDHDGRNDLFRDADGDGINDVDGKEYPHRFRFIDADKNGINDVFVDVDGDGVNDLNANFLDEDGDGICDNVIDYHGRFINDITGIHYTAKSLRGYKFGFIREEQNRMMRNFIDEDADGIADIPRGKMGGPGQQHEAAPGRDRFIDRDGDGIDDRRQHMERLRKGKK